MSILTKVEKYPRFIESIKITEILYLCHNNMKVKMFLLIHEAYQYYYFL